MVFNMWGLSLLTSESRTGFKKNSSAPSSKHLFPIINQNPPFNQIQTSTTTLIETRFSEFNHISQGLKNTFIMNSSSIYQQSSSYISLFSYLLILAGTFSDDIITTGMFFRVLDPCKTRETPSEKHLPDSVCSTGK